MFVCVFDFCICLCVDSIFVYVYVYSIFVYIYVQTISLNISDKDIEAIIQAKPAAIECALLSVKDALDKLGFENQTPGPKVGKISGKGKTSN